MKSLRAQLAVGLSVGFLVLLGLGGAAVYVSTRAALLREFDTALRLRAESLVALTEYDNGKVTLDLADNAVMDYEHGRPAAYFQVWLADGTTLARSRSLDGADLPALLADGPRPRFWNLRLPNGMSARAIGVRSYPHPSDESATARSGTPPLITIVVARNRNNLNHHLQFLATGLLVVGILIMGCGVLFTTAIVRRVLAPLSRLAEQTSTINATSLHSRFPTEGLPVELTPVAERLNALLSRLEQSFERERRFTADAAHELRTPIAELRTLAEVALKWPEDEQATEESFRDALAITQKMEALVAGLLTLARYETGKQSLAHEPIKLASFVTEIWTPCAELVRRKHINTTVEIPDDLAIRTDCTLFGLIITNLLTNAAEYTPRDGIVRIHATRRDGAFTLTVANTATGLTTDDLSHLFERFWRKDPARTVSEHSGLGLALAKVCADALGMTLTASMLEFATLTVSLSGGLA